MKSTKQLLFYNAIKYAIVSLTEIKLSHVQSSLNIHSLLYIIDTAVVLTRTGSRPAHRLPERVFSPLSK